MFAAAQRARTRLSPSRRGAPEDYTKTETSEIRWLETSRKEEMHLKYIYITKTPVLRAEQAHVHWQI